MEWVVFKKDTQKRPRYQSRKEFLSGPMVISDFRNPFWNFAPEKALKFESKTEAVVQAVRTGKQARCTTYVCTYDSAVERAARGFSRRHGYSTYSGASQ